MAVPTDWTSVIEAFAAQRAERPHAPAVTGSYGDWSYEQLGLLADRVATAVPAGREARVGYLGARDQRFLAVVLGVLGSGAAYVPLDPAWPAARIAEVAEESGLARVFVDGAHAAVAAAAGLADVVHVDEVLAVAEPPAPAVRRDGSAADLAYVVFTSGSTGRPKGVLTEHAALLNNCAGIAARWGLTEDDRVLQFTTLGVDITLEEAFSAWVAGAALVLMDPAVGADLAAFTAFLAEHRVSALDLPTSFWSTWLAAVEAGDVPPPPATVRVVAVGSEEVGSDEIARWHAVAGPYGAVYNMYGSTEQAITSIVAGPIAPGDPIGTGVIGTPLPGVRAYVLDGDLRPVPPGAPGELYVGGLAVARGYTGQPARTAARFRPDPFAEEPGARMYATGDRAVALTDGSFRFAGRIDDRLKVRGFTVQPREVELVLLGVPGVAKAVVAAEPGPDGRDRVVAEVFATVPGGEVERLVAALTAATAERLPAPAQPQRYTVHTDDADEPRTLRPAAARAAAGSAPEDLGHPAAVAAVTALWQELLGAQEIGPHDSFLDLGGNSLMVTQLVTRLRSRLGVELGFAEFFAAPTVAAVVAAVVAADAPVTGQTGPVVLTPRELPRTGAEQGPAWSGQERMWFLNRLAPESAAYNLPLVFEVSGPLDLGALERALHTVLERHEPLRTAIRFEDGRLVQSVRPVAVRIETAVTAATSAEELRAADGLLAAFVARPFDLAAGALLRAALLDCADGNRLLAFAVHHSAFDEWSSGLFVAELGAAYAATARGAEPALPPLGARYLDFSAWQAGSEFRAHAEGLHGFWREYLDGLPQSLPLPADREAPREPSGAGGARAFTVGPRQTAALTALAQREGVTRYHALLTLYAVFLARHADQYDLAIGVPTANRGSEELERLIGLFVNTLPVRADLTDNPRFAEAVQRLSHSTLAAQGAADLPLDEIARATGRPGTPGENPIFRTMFLMDEERVDLDLVGTRVTTLELPARTSTLDLTLILGEYDGRMEGRLWYSADLFDEESADRLVETFLALVDRVVADPDLKVKDIPFVPAGARALTVGEPAAGPRAPLALQIAETARRYPERTAVVADGASLTYQELLALVDDIRGWLLAAGPVPEFVPLVLPGGSAMLAAMVAVNSLGAAFVPVDPDWPAQRITDILAELGNPLAVVAADEAAQSAVRAVRTVRAPSAPVGEHAPTPWQLAPEHGDRPMYAIYTSGSTGRPKGAVVHHLGVANRIAWMNREFGAEAADTVLQTTPPVYDSCVWEYLWPLTLGGRAVLSGPTLQASPERLLEVIAAHRVRTIDLVPAMLDGLVRHAVGRPEVVEALGSLRVAIVGGEELGRGVARRFEELGLPARLYNLYGPTEASIGSMFHRVTGGDRGRVLIGRPIDGTGAVVLDERRQLVPVNVVGELYLAGDCVGLGYLDNAGETRRRFVENRFAGDLPGTRLYRTGDLARVRPDGEVEFRGRADEQIKIRGVRVEPAEVVAALEAHPGVAQVAVLAAPVAGAGDRTRERVAALLAAAPAELAAAAWQRVTRAGIAPTTTTDPEH
ncbi:amino acid adenylation domain-containing protein [Kitasatospora sp. NPDC059146]|uniref:amino acid adenylation domain-containing protein n=1 Tax=Kitasatospora sp. NPDC059146 TaxID=3346741 RepID=UPI0036846884